MTGIPPVALYGTAKNSRSLIFKPSSKLQIEGALLSPRRIQGRKVGVIYSAAHLGSTISVQIE